MAARHQNSDRNQANGATSDRQTRMYSEQRMPFLYKCLFVIMILLSLTFFLTYLMKTNQLLQETEKLNEEITEKEEEVEELRYLIDSPVDDAYIIRVAREKLGLVFPDEEIFYNGFLPVE